MTDEMKDVSHGALECMLCDVSSKHDAMMWSDDEVSV